VNNIDAILMMKIGSCYAKDFARLLLRLAAFLC